MAVVAGLLFDPHHGVVTDVAVDLDLIVAMGGRAREENPLVLVGSFDSICQGINAAMDALRARSNGTVKRVLLLSDGEATADMRDVASFGRLAERARDMVCAISSVGVDVDYNERIMSTIARRSNGRHYFVENPAGLH